MIKDGVLPAISSNGHASKFSKDGFTNDDEKSHKKKTRTSAGKRKIKTNNLKRCSASIQPLGTREIKKERADKKPLKYCTFITKHPVIAFVSTLALHVTVILTTTLLMVTGYTVFPIEFDELPLILYTDIDRTQDLAWRDSMKYDFRVYRPVLGVTLPMWYNGWHGDTLEVIFQGDNVFSKQNLELINATEDRLYNFRNFQSDYCLVLDFLRTCQKPISVLRLFDGTYKNIDPVFDTGSFSNASYVICQATKFNETKEFIQLVLQKNYDPCVQSQTSDKTRIFQIFGWPLRGSGGSTRLQEYQVYQIKPELENIRDNLLAGKLSLYYISEQLFQHDVSEQSFTDMKLAIGSFLFIFIFMLIQTASFWITFFGLLSILTSFLLTNLIYRFVLSYEYFGFFHILSIFIILGIGADDVFVFYDSWRLSGHDEFPSKAHRLSECYRKAAKTTFVTSLTTMSAFLVSAPSPLLPVSSFGIFSGMLVGINYLFDLFCFPVVILVYSEAIKPLFDKIVSKLKCCNLKTQDNEKPKRAISKVALISPRRTSMLPPLPRIRKYSLNDAPIDEEKQESRTEKDKANFEDRNKVVLFLKNGFFDFMTRRIVKIATPLVFISVSIFFIHSASTIEPDSNQVEIFISSHNYGKAYKLHYYGFQRNYEDEETRIRLSWGVKPQNMDDCNFKSRDYCRGTTEWVDDFDASSEEAQVAIMNLCNRLETLTDAEIDSYKIKRNALTNKPEIACFMSAMYNYYQNMASIASVYNFTVPFPFTNTSVLLFMNYNSHIYDVSKLPADFDRYLEIMVSYWLTNGYTAASSEDYWMYSRLIGEQKISGVTQSVSVPPAGAYGMVYGTKLKVIGIEINTTMSYFTLGYPEGKPVYERWEKLIDEEVSKMPASLKSGFQSTLNTWHWIKVQETLVDSAVIGIAVGISLAFPILTFTTLNILIGLIATICIGLVTTIVVGIIPLAGWKLGVLESLNLCLVVGLSVDYIVHLAEAYRSSEYQSRDDRVKCMLENMGLSVLSGAITTFGAAIFMLFAKIKFLFQFGIFVMSTVGLSLLFSFFFFTTFMALFGPQGETGSLIALYKLIKEKVKGQKNMSMGYGSLDEKENEKETKVRKTKRESFEDDKEVLLDSMKLENSIHTEHRPMLHSISENKFMHEIEFESHVMHSQITRRTRLESLTEDENILQTFQNKPTTRRKTLAPIMKNMFFSQKMKNARVETHDIPNDEEDVYKRLESLTEDLESEPVFDEQEVAHTGSYDNHLKPSQSFHLALSRGPSQKDIFNVVDSDDEFDIK